MFLYFAVVCACIAVCLLVSEPSASNTINAWFKGKGNRTKLFPLMVFIPFYLVYRNVLLATASAIAVLVAEYTIKCSSKNKRQKQLSEQLVDALRILSSSVQAGLSLSQGISGLASEVPAPLGHEFRKVQLDTTLGIGVSDALTAMSNRCNNPDVRMMTIAINVQSQTGGHLSPILMNISNVIRERQKISGKLNAATAQGKLSGIVISCIPPFMVLIIESIQPGYFEPLITTTLGMLITLLMLLMNVVGGIWILRVSSPKHSA